jgi:hypothetical protein
MLIRLAAALLLSFPLLRLRVVERLEAELDDAGTGDGRECPVAFLYASPAPS